MLRQILSSVWAVYLEAAPFVVFGLFLAGWMKILVRERSVTRYLGQANLKSALYAWLFGLPLPVCSCGVVPLSFSLHNKRASREALLAFLLGTPETSVGALTLTWGLLGPVMAIARPLASLFMSLGAAVLSIAVGPGLSSAAESVEPDSNDVVTPDLEACALPEPEEGEADYHVVGLSGLKASLRQALRPPDKMPESSDANQLKPVSLRVLIADAHRYGFTELLDDIAIWFSLGIVAAGMIAALVPAEWIGMLPGGKLSTMLLVLLLSLPLYACAVESTPLAASLVLKGLSPGAALVFLLAGPASNITSLVLLRQHFGRRFVGLYLAAVGVLSVLAGLALDALLGATGWQVVPQIAAVESAPWWQAVVYASATLLLLLLLRSWWRTPWRSELAKAQDWLRTWLSLVGLAGSTPNGQRVRWGRVGFSTLLLALLGFGASGFQQVPLGHEAFRLRFGQLVESHLQPGLHYHWPAPFAELRVFSLVSVHKRDIGFRTDLKKLARWRVSPLDQGAQSWHSFFTNMGRKTGESRYLLGDQTQVELKLSLHYRVDDAKAFYLDLDDGDSLVALCAESAMHKLVASAEIEDLLTTARGVLAPQGMQDSQACLDQQGAGAKILGLYLVDLHPPQEVVAAFRDVASASVDLETRVHQAEAERARSLPRARAQAQAVESSAQALTRELVSKAEGQAQSFSLRASAAKSQPSAARFRLRLETLERILPGQRKIIAPTATRGQGRMTLWTDAQGWGSTASALPPRPKRTP